MRPKHPIVICLTVMLFALVTVGALLWFESQAAYATPGTLYVAPGGCGSATPCYSTVQAAVDAAQPGDEIRVAAGTYPIQAGTAQVALVGKSLLFKGGYTTGNWTTPDPDANPTLLNGLGQGRVMVISGTIDVTVEGLRLVYGNAAGLGGHTDGKDAGGGLYILGASVHLERSWIMTNTTPSDGFGGGIYARNSSGRIVIEDCLIQGNYANSGGGIYLRDSMSTLAGNVIQNNTSEGYGSGVGIRVYSGEAILSGNTISNNSGGAGGGIAIANATTTLVSNTIDHNTTWSGGGGVLIANSTVWFDQNTIQSNSSQIGGGVNAGNGSIVTIDFIGNNVFALQAQGTLANTNAQVVQATGNDHGEI
jgi:parallel beta-helix repeat protein